MKHLPAASDEESLRHAFRLLAAVELGKVSEWAGPIEYGPLRTRVEVLSLLLNMIPRGLLRRLPEVVSAWCVRFPQIETASTAELRKVAHDILRDSTAERTDAGDATAALERIDLRTDCFRIFVTICGESFRDTKRAYKRYVTLQHRRRWRGNATKTLTRRTDRPWRRFIALDLSAATSPAEVCFGNDAACAFLRDCHPIAANPRLQKIDRCGSQAPD